MGRFDGIPSLENKNKLDIRKRRFIMQPNYQHETLYLHKFSIIKERRA